MVALFGTGQIAAQQLGILDRMHNRASLVPGVEVDREGRRRPGMSIADAPGTPWILLRGDAESAAFDGLPADVDVRHSTTPTAISQDDDGVDVTLLDTASGRSTTERFDLVVGADGLRSTVRRLAFGPHEQYLHRLNHMVAAFRLDRTPEGLAQGQTAMLLEPGRGMYVFGFADRPPAVLLSYRTDDVDAEFTAPPAERLRAAFGPEPLGDLLTANIDAFEASEDTLFDSAEQVRMNRWRRGRVVLNGDAAWCLTLYSGMGVSAGMAGANMLGEALDRHPGDVPGALATWEQTLRPFIDDYQQFGLEQRMIFVPDNRRQIALRRSMSWARQHPLGRRLLSRFVPDPGSKNADIVATMREPALVDG